MLDGEPAMHHDPAPSSTAPATPERLPPSLAWLALGAFAIGTESFIVAGLLPVLAADLRISPTHAGQLVLLFALSYAIGSPLMAAAFGGFDEIVAMLLARHAELAATDRVDKTAMIYAAGEGHAGVVRQLLDAGVDVNTVYANGLTALMWAAGYDKVDTVRLLLSRGARPELRDNRGLSAREIADQAGAKTVAGLLSAQH